MGFDTDGLRLLRPWPNVFCCRLQIHRSPEYGRSNNRIGLIALAIIAS